MLLDDTCLIHFSCIKWLFKASLFFLFLFFLWIIILVLVTWLLLHPVLLMLLVLLINKIKNKSNYRWWDACQHESPILVLLAQTSEYKLIIWKCQVEGGWQTLFHGRTRASYVYNVCLAWYNVVLTPRIHSSVKFVGLPLATRATVE